MIVMLILVGVTVTIALNGGLFGITKEATFKTMMSEYKEQVDTYTVGIRADTYAGGTTNIADINAGATDRTPNVEMSDILGTEVKKGYEEKVAVEMGELFYVPTDIEDNNVKNEIKWCFEIGVKVKGYDSYTDFENGVYPVSDGSYEAVGGVYLNTPDVSKFNKENTYYVTYDESGENETVGDKITEGEPSNWYNYKNKIWANVKTMNNGNVAYWVWIPRYAYKITYYTDEALSTPSPENAVTSYGNIDIKFLSTENEWKDYDTGETKQYDEESLSAEGYKLSEAFSWDGKQIAGYWVSKYEVSAGAGELGFNIEKTVNSGIKIISSSIKNMVGPYNYYLDDDLKYTGTGDYTFESLVPNKEYTIKVEDREGVTTSRKVYPVNAEAELNPDSEPKSNPDLTGFKNTVAYYVTYDANGENEKIGDKITFDGSGQPNNIPEGWYNYRNKIWANIVTANEDLTEGEKADIKTATTKKVAYWVWIPRYEYKIIDAYLDSDFIEGDKGPEVVDINFIDTGKTTATEGYKIPESFSWGGTALSGYWVSKYEVSQ